MNTLSLREVLDYELHNYNMYYYIRQILAEATTPARQVTLVIQVRMTRFEYYIIFRSHHSWLSPSSLM